MRRSHALRACQPVARCGPCLLAHARGQAQARGHADGAERAASGHAAGDHRAARAATVRTGGARRAAGTTGAAAAARAQRAAAAAAAGRASSTGRAAALAARSTASPRTTRAGSPPSAGVRADWPRRAPARSANAPRARAGAGVYGDAGAASTRPEHWTRPGTPIRLDLFRDDDITPRLGLWAATT